MSSESGNEDGEASVTSRANSIVYAFNLVYKVLFPNHTTP